MTVIRGKLVFSRKGSPMVKVEGNTFAVARGELSASLGEGLCRFEEQEVELEMHQGQPKRVREAGGVFVPPHGGGDDRGRGEQKCCRGAGPQKYCFHNPYNFVPAPPRKTDHPELGDREPVCQDRFLPRCYSGRLQVEMEVVTPLLLPETDPRKVGKRQDDHKVFPLRVDEEGRPLLPASSVRGMLRSAYEAVTNSRLGRFSRRQHEKRLAFRMDPRDALGLVPARIEGSQLHLLTGTSQVGQDGRPQGPLYAAWLPRYSGKDKATDRALKYAGSRELPRHGQEVVCRIERQRHRRGFSYWRVKEIRKGNRLSCLGPPPPSDGVRHVRGWVCITNANIKHKHDERVFFTVEEVRPPGPFPLTRDLREQWQELVENYQELHREEIGKRKAEGREPDEYLGSEPGGTAWSRHVYRREDRELRDGTLCYARLNQERTAVEALLPVSISRELYPCSPWDLLHPSLRPAEDISQLSPADRVFGWVRTEKPKEATKAAGRDERVAVRGLLRVGPVRCLTPANEAVEVFPGDGLPLAVLSSPKPQQGRFYVARSPQGEAQADGLDKRAAGYAPGKGLRGRKVYPHHRHLPPDYWDRPLEDRTQEPRGHPPRYQEYRRPREGDREQRDSQNHSVLGWVKPGTRFTFALHFLNLSKVELGALLYLLQLPEGHYHRLGGGKPLGFGSVRLELKGHEIWDRRCLGKRYRNWAAHPESAADPDKFIAAFETAVEEVYGEGGGFEEVPFIAAFLRACSGFADRKPIHYPRVTKDGRYGPPSPKGESFRWFVENEKKECRCALPDLVNDPGLPILKGKTGNEGKRKKKRDRRGK